MGILRGLIGDTLDVLSQPRVKGRIEHVLVEMLSLSLPRHGAGRAGQTVGVVDVGELRAEVRHVANGVELQITQVLPKRRHRLLLLRAEQSLPRPAGVREAEDEKGLTLRRDEMLAAIRGADGPRFDLVGGRCR
ncbi:MAG: hypothetical protein EBS05_07900 [Proteobacteria bacterium]|nr:hypothetical protein [Pseudomonadota bacterium]